jgi:RNA polymerase sigma factor (TIGR02999 family)
VGSRLHPLTREASAELISVEAAVYNRGKRVRDGTASGVTELLLAWSRGDQAALAALLPRVYEELRKLASGYLRQERPGHTLQTSDLVNEAFLRLVDQDRVQWRNRAQFFGIAAQMMRRILVDRARSHLYAKRGGGAPRLSLDEALTLAAERAPELVALDEALEELAKIEPDRARIVELRFFGGLTSEEIAQVLDVSVPTVTRGWRMARAWLYRELAARPGAP